MYAFQTSTVSAIIVGFLLMMCLYVLMASVVAVYAPELFATKVRFRCVGFANAVAKLLNVLMPMVVGWMLTSLGATSIFVAISAIAITSMLIVGFFVAETAQKSLGDRFPHSGITADNVHSASCVVICRAPFCCSSNCW